MKYTVRDGKYLSLRPFGKEKAVRTGRLGKGYAKEEIRERIAGKTYVAQAGQNYRKYGNAQEIRDILYHRVTRSPGWHMSSFQRQFYRRWYRTYLIRRPNMKEAWKYKRDIIELQKISDSLRYLTDRDIRDGEQVCSRQEEIESGLAALQARRRAVSSQMYGNTVFKNVRAYRKVMEEAEDGLSPETEKKLRILKERIEERMPFDEAVGRLNYLKDERKKITAAIREGKRELKTLAHIGQLVSDPIHPEPGDDYYVKVRAEKLKELKGERDETKRRNVGIGQTRQEQPDKPVRYTGEETARKADHKDHKIRD